jgi:hypothetical protein
VTECVKGTDQGEPLGGNTTARGGAKKLHVSASIKVEARMRDKTPRVGRLDLPGILPSFQCRIRDAEDAQDFFAQAIRLAKSADLGRRDHPCSAHPVRVEQSGVDPLFDHIDFHRATGKQGLAQSMYGKSVELLLAATHIR